MTVLVTLWNGETRVDEDDLPLVDAHMTGPVRYRWKLQKDGYVARWEPTGEKGKYRYILFHRCIHETPAKMLVDHIDGDRLNNTKANLRTVNRGENARNRKMHEGNASGFKGVSFNKPLGKYTAYITLNYKSIYLGAYTTAEAAARAYAAAAPKYHGRAVRQDTLISSSNA